MGWNDKATDAQLNAFLHMVRWDVAIDESLEMGKYLEENATRREMSNELGRIRKLSIDRKLTKDTIFDGELWANYKK